MDTILKFCVVAIAALMCFIGLSSAACPDNKQLIQQDVERCFAKIGLNSQTLASTDVSSVKKLCRDQVYKRAIGCLRKIYDSCVNHEEIRAFLDKLINLDHYDSAFKYICANLEVFDRNSQCIRQVDSDGAAMSCVGAESKIFEKEIAAKTQTGELKPGNAEAIFPLHCKYMDKIVACTIRPYEACGHQVMDIMSRIVKLVIPNICNELRAQTGAAKDENDLSREELDRVLLLENISKVRLEKSKIELEKTKLGLQIRKLQA